MFKTFGFQGGGGGSGGQFNPAQLFANGAAGFFYNLALPNIFYQDFALTPATALGDAIRIIVDALSLGREKRIFFNGATNTYVSIPDFAMSAATTLRLFGRIKAYTLAPSALQMICGQWNATGNQRAYRLVLNTDGTLGFMISTDGTSQAGNIVASTAAVSTIVAAGVDILVDATLTFATKAVVFQYSLDDGATWDDLGDPGATTDDTIHNSTATFTGGASASGADLFTGSAAYVGASFDGAATATIDAASYSTGSSWTATTGQTVTRNGSAFILGDGYHAVAPSDATRMQLGRMPYGGRRNILTFSRAFGNAAWTKNNIAVTTTNETSWDGTATASLLTSSSTDLTAVYRTITGITDLTVPSIYAKAGTKTVIQLSCNSANWGSDKRANFDLTNGVLGTVDSGMNATITAMGSGWYRCSAAPTGAGNQLVWCVVDAANSAREASATAGTIYLTDAQVDVTGAVTAPQVVDAAYDITESGVPSVTWLYGAGTQYYSILGSRNLTCMHDGTGGFAGMNVYVNKVDDAAVDYFFSSRTGNNTGCSALLDDSSTADGVLGIRINDGTTSVFGADSSNGAIPRFDPFTLTHSFATAASPDVSAAVNGIVKVSGDISNPPTTDAATVDFQLFAQNGSGILPGYLSSVVMGAVTNSVQQTQVRNWLMQQVGA